MVAYPEAQSRAHAELVSVVGCDRLPAFADYPHLPYLRVVLWSKEVLRWGPAAPLATPHRSTESDWYGGIFHPERHDLYPERVVHEPRPRDLW